MNAKNLMIGDWVMYNHHTLARIYSIQAPIPRKGRFDNKWLITISRDGLIDTEVEYIEPIPLTAEILEKNEFKLLKCKTEMQSDNFIVTFYGNHLDIIVTEETEQIRISKNIRYVHELQHTLRLCGLNKLVDNFKVIE